MILSMTGYASRPFTVGDEVYKVEFKTLNHRFLDLKLRLPRDLIGFETAIKSLVETRLKRGSVDLWIERQTQKKQESKFQIDEARAKAAFQTLNELKVRFNLKDEVSIRDLVSFPEVLAQNSGTELGADALEALKQEVLNGVAKALDDLIEMRKAEGMRLKQALLSITNEFKLAHSRLETQRESIRERAREKVGKRIQQCFEAYPSTEEKMRALLETRIAQEISYTLEKLDIEEELTRFAGHVKAIEQHLNEGGSVGKKLDFLFQELNREINTLGNKSQDLEISSEVIDLKMRVEQMREQSLNLE
jgi:uncharacterized protein (TIGR00255 family)